MRDKSGKFQQQARSQKCTSRMELLANKFTLPQSRSCLMNVEKAKMRKAFSKENKSLLFGDTRNT